ncbi:MAG: fluoride efflux transporter CrcB [Cellvibrionaceae bacterium]
MMWLAVAIGGALGAMSRYGLMQFIPASAGSFPWAVWWANIVGSTIIGLLYVLIVEKGLIAAEWRPLLIVGFLGALTTFSTFALDAVLLWQAGQIGTALSYVLSSVLGCLLCAIGGIWLAQKLF